MHIEGSIALVRGANWGIGRVLVEAQLNAGAANVYACVRHTETLDDLVRHVDMRVIALQEDVRDSTSVSKAAGLASDVTLLINNAGTLEGKDLTDVGVLESLMRETDLNVYGMVWLSLAFAPLSKTNGGTAAIANMLSSAASMNDLRGSAVQVCVASGNPSRKQPMANLVFQIGTLLCSCFSQCFAARSRCSGIAKYETMYDSFRKSND